MNKRSLIFLVPALLGVVAIASAEDTPAGKINLQQAISVALSNNSGYKIAQEAVEQADEQVNEAWGMLWPQLSSDASLTRQWAEAGSTTVIDGQYSVNLVNAQLSMNPGAFYNTLLSTRNARGAAQSAVDKVRADIQKGTIDLYYKVVLAQETMDLQQKALEALGENVRVVTAGYEKGLFSKLDYLSAKVEYSNQQTELQRAQNNLLSAEAAFNILLGRDINEPVSPDFDPSRFDKDELERYIKDNGDEDSLVGRMTSESLRHRPELIQKKMTREAYENAADAEASIYIWPSFFIQGKYTTSKIIYAEDMTSSSGSSSYLSPDIAALMSYMSEMQTRSYPQGWNDSWQVTVGATYRWGALSPLDPSHARSRRNESKARQAEYELEDFLKNVTLEVKTGFLNLKTAWTTIQSQKENVVIAEENYRVAMAQFRNGIIDNTKLLNAHVQLLRAKTMYIQAVHGYHTAKAQLNTIIGSDFFTLY